MKTFLDFFVSIGGAVLMAMVMRPGTRQKWVPYAFAYMMWWALSGTTFILMISIHLWRICWALHLVSIAVVLSEFKRRYLRQNPALMAFLLFFVWFAISGFLGDGVFSFKIDYFFHILRMIAIGLVAGFWIRESKDGFNRFFSILAFAVFASALQYVVHGGWNVDAMADAGGRMVIDTSNLVGDESAISGSYNVNRFALLTSMALPFPFLALFENVRTRHRKALVFCSVVACLVLVLVLIKTGSRNGGLSLLAFGWYLVFAKTKIKAGRKFLIMIVLTLSVVVGVHMVMGGLELRTFNLIEGETGAFEDSGNGRGRMFLAYYESTTPVEHLLGKGLPMEYLETLAAYHVANYHSIYTQMFVHSGYVGLALFAVFCLVYWRGSRHVANGSIAFLFLLIFLLTGVGEAANLSAYAGFAKYGLGIGLAFCCTRRRNDYCVGAGNEVRHGC